MINLFKRNKKSRFDALYDRYANQLYLLVLRYVVSQFDAEEVVQRGFIKVHQALDNFKYESERATIGWLNQIMVNEALLFLREQKRLWQMMEVDTLETEHLYASEADLDLSYEECLKLVRQLPDGYRTVFNLYAIEGYSHKEIAELLKISESASRSQLSRARTLLKQAFKTSDYANELIG
ncbi:MAG: sigma-70 family RNA polymerase sigma factor [Carboxylicivirga sp.]|jgi:RNA polymerase sigma-70 factor (ECF subfamily)|nr:sigma-70 family RNA polymerase sigma factor [Carboxylicivirga sp.]